MKKKRDALDYNWGVMNMRTKMKRECLNREKEREREIKECCSR